MSRLPLFFGASLLCVSLATTSVSAENWPGWRGPRGDGTSLEANVPVRWNAPAEKNVAWKTEIPGGGHASPVVWDEAVLLATCLPDTRERQLLRLDRTTGKIVWRQTVLKSALESRHLQNSYASSTPATDGKRIFVTFLEVDGRLVPAPNVGTPRDITPGRMTAAAYDLDGKKLWLVQPGDFLSAHGFCTSPVLYRDLVILNGDHDGKSYLVALRQETGEEVWRIPRAHGIRSYVTPLLREIAGGTQLVLSGSSHVVGLDPADGRTLWTVDGPTEQFVASPVCDGARFFLVAGYPTYHVMAIKPDGRGNVTGTHVAWHGRNVACYVPSPVVVGRHLVVADDRGTANCFDAQSGERLWQGRMGRHYHASLVTAGGLVYFTDDDGLTKVVRPGPQMEVVAENPLGEAVSSSPAISHGRFFLRGEKHLFCLGGAEPAAE